MQNYTLIINFVKLHTMCKITHCVQNYTGVPVAFNVEKFLSLGFFYTHYDSGVKKCDMEGFQLKQPKPESAAGEI